MGKIKNRINTSKRGTISKTSARKDDYLDPIIVTGAPRSGTSLIAGILRLCGVFGGSNPTVTPENPKGFFENRQIIESIEKPFLSRYGYDPMGQTILPDTVYLKGIDNRKEWRKSVLSIMKGHGLQPNQSWYFKDPKALLLWPVWQNAFPDTKWVIVRREDIHIAESCMNTSFMRAYNDLHDWVAYVNQFKERIYELEKECNYIEIWSDKIINQDFAKIKSFIESIGLKFNEEKVKSFIDVRLWHYRNIEFTK